MSRRKVEIVVLCEDSKHESFVRRYLRKKGFNPAQIRVRPYPAGSRAGEQWVRLRYVEEMTLQRRRVGRIGSALIVVIDADLLGVEQRARQLDDLLAEAGLGRRVEGERVALVVPCRNIESWVHFTATQQIDETTDFKPRYRAIDDCKGVADLVVEACLVRGLAEQGRAPPSLAVACRELQRVVPP